MTKQDVRRMIWASSFSVNNVDEGLGKRANEEELIDEERKCGKELDDNEKKNGDGESHKRRRLQTKTMSNTGSWFQSPPQLRRTTRQDPHTRLESQSKSLSSSSA